MTRPSSPPGSLLDLAGQLMTDVARLVDQRLELLRLELRQEASDAMKKVGLVGAGATMASVGLAFLLLALGLWVGDLVGSRSGGLAIVGGAFCLAGGALGFLGARALRRQRLMPETMLQLRRDAQWIQSSK